MISVILPFCQKDAHLALKLLDVCKHLDGTLDTHCLLATDESCENELRDGVLNAAKRVFSEVSIFTSPEIENKSWPSPQNTIFAASLVWADSIALGPFLWLEPDCVPLKKKWLDTISEEYHNSGKDFLGHIVDFKGKKILYGTAVYPSTAKRILLDRVLEHFQEAWDVACSDITVPQTHKSDLIYCFYGEREKPPTFINGKMNSIKYRNLPSNAVMFHRCQDASLHEIILCQDKENIGKLNVCKAPSKPQKLLPVITPVCAKDFDIACKNLTWQAQLGGTKDAQLLIVGASELGHPETLRLVDLGLNAYGTVTFTKLPFRWPNEGWPSGPNFSFIHGVRQAQQIWNSPFWWNEPDCVPLKEAWLQLLSDEYYNTHLPFMGKIEPVGTYEGGGQILHLPGNAAYPASVLDDYPKAFQNMEHAWDVVLAMEYDIVRLTKETALFQQIWGEDTHKPPVFDDEKSFRLINGNAAVFHRDKEGKVIDRLISGWRP